jgi:hypothetical protein
MDKLWLIEAYGNYCVDGTDRMYRMSIRAFDAAEAFRVFAARYGRYVSYYKISVTEVKQNE